MFPFTRNNKSPRSPLVPQHRPIITSTVPRNLSAAERRSAAIATGRLCKSQANNLRLQATQATTK